ncbi:hypothetical protein Tco_0866755 [Tanacetum coccineum]
MRGDGVEILATASEGPRDGVIEIVVEAASQTARCRSGRFLFGRGKTTASRAAEWPMDTLSMVSKYLNDLEEYLDDGDSMEAKKIRLDD